MNAIIIDDDDACRESLVQLISSIDKITLSGSFSSAKEALSTIKKEDVNLIFLDVEMPEMNGLEFLCSLDIKPQVIITSSYKKYAFEAFDYEVIDYLLKPITLSRLIKSVFKAEKSLNETSSLDMGKNKDYFFIKNESVIRKILVKDVLWIEALGDYVKIHTSEKKYILHSTLKKIESKLPPDKFVRVHRSHIIQLDNVRNIQDTTIYIADMYIPLGAIYRENFLNKLNLLS